MKNNPRIQLHSIFHKTGNRNNMKVLKFQSHRFSSLPAIKKTVNGVEEGEGGSSFYSYHYFRLHINFQ